VKSGEERSAEGIALVDAATQVGTGDDRHDQVVAFDVALAVRDNGDEQALVALDVMLDVLRTAVAPSYGTLVNVLTAIQYALILPDESLGRWRPPPGSLGRMLDHALAGNEPLRRQVDDLLWALVERQRAGSWLGRRASTVAWRVEAPALQAALEAQAEQVGISYIKDGYEAYPSDAIAA
jgi:hypothetical protein